MKKPLTAATHPDRNKNDLIVVTGAGGFIAGSLIRYLRTKGLHTSVRLIKNPYPSGIRKPLALKIYALI